MSSTSTKGMTKQMVEAIREQMHDRVNALFENLTYNENDELVDKLSYKWEQKYERWRDEVKVAGETFSIKTTFSELQPLKPE